MDGRSKGFDLAADGICGFSRRGQGGEMMYVGNPQTKSVRLRDAANSAGLPVERKGVLLYEKEIQTSVAVGPCGGALRAHGLCWVFF